jgi:hypothetical protein
VTSLKKGGEKVLAVVGNKSDLIHMKQVSDTEATRFCGEYNCMCFEASASDSYTDVANAFLMNNIMPTPFLV